jgi:hypothetical protein
VNRARLTIPLIAALASAAPLLPASPASAEQSRLPRVYKVTAEGSGSFQYDLSLPSGDGLGVETKRNVDFAWNVKLPSVAFFSNGEGVALTATTAAEGGVTGSGTEETTIVGSDGHGGTVTTHGLCEAKDASLPAFSPTITADPRTADPNAGGANLTVSPFQSIAFPANCTQSIYGGKGVVAVEAEPHQFQQRFFLPVEATRQGKIIQLVQASSQQKDKCPPTVGLGDCKLDWHGTLTFEFTGYLGGDGELTEDDLPDLPAGGGAPSDDDLIVPLPSGGHLSRRGDTASVNVKCAIACSGFVRAYPVTRGAGHAAAASKPLAKARFKAAAGKAVKVKLRFRGAAQRKVRKARAVRLVVATGSAQRTVTVRVPRRT